MMYNVMDTGTSGREEGRDMVAGGEDGPAAS